MLLLPWETYRTFGWNHGEAVLDPWTRLLSRPLIWDDGTRAAAGVRFVLDDAAGAQAGPRLPGAVVIIDQPGLTVYQLPS